MPLVFPPNELIRAWLPVYQAFFGALSAPLGSPGAQPTSLFREPIHNARVGGHPRSQHLLGFALDVAGMADLDDIAERGRRVGLVTVRESDHVHFQLFPARTLPEEVFRFVHPDTLRA